MNNVEILKIMLALLLIIIIFSSFIMTLIIFRISLESERDIEKKIKNRRNKMTDKEFNDYVHEYPSYALLYCLDKLTPDQLDYCVHKMPSVALRCCPDRLTAEQKKYCEEKKQNEDR